MGYEEILDTSPDGKFRVKLVLDEYADEPCNDCQSPLLRIDAVGYDGYRAEHVMVGSRPTDNDANIEAAAIRWGSPSGSSFVLFEKYLRAYYGVTNIETWYSGSYWYVTYDPASWREYVGAPAGSANMDEYRAWCEGEVYGYVVEENVTWQRVDDPDDQHESWEEIFDYSSWGYYGDTDYLRETAREALRDRIAADVPAAPVSWWRRAFAWFWLVRS